MHIKPRCAEYSALRLWRFRGSKIFFRRYLTRGATAGAMSLAGGVFSTLVMWLLLRFTREKLGLIGVSIICAAAHNIAQLTVAAFITGTKSVLYYAPFLGIYAVITGAVTGLLLKAVMPALEKQKNLFIRK